MAVPLYEPSPRVSPFFSSVNGQIYMWGGCTDNFSTAKGEKMVSIEIFDSYQTWITKKTEKDPPLWVYDGACTSSGHNIYMYGGHAGKSLYGSLYEFNTRTSSWRELASHSADSPMKKWGCGMAVCGDKCVLFGGYGIPSGPIQSGADFVRNNSRTDGSGWTNEMHTFDLNKGTWSSPTVSGTRPPPCVSFSFTMIDGHHAVLFGGYHTGLGMSNDAFIMDLTAMHWSKLDYQESPHPVGRSFHVGVCLGYGEDNPKLLVTGGFDDDVTLSDMWMLDLDSRKWKEVQVPSLQTSRFKHCAAASTISPGVTKVVMFGGCPEWPKNPKTGDDFKKLAMTAVLQFELQSLTGEWLLTDAADNSQQGTSERIREKMSQMAQSAAAAKPAGRDKVVRDLKEEVERRVLAEVNQVCEAERRVHIAEERAIEAERLSAESNQVVTPMTQQSIRRKGRTEELEQRIREMERKMREVEEGARDAEERANMAERRLGESKRRAGEAERRLQESERRVDEAERRLQESERRVDEAERRLQETERRVNEAERRAGEAERRLQESERRVNEAERRVEDVERRCQEPEEPQWVVRREEIQLTGPELGRGGWATVSVATFRGVQVAAKSIHRQIISRHTSRLFKREMNMAARIRHPNLIQFVGATLEGEMIILMELMPTSLRRQLEREYMPPSQVSSIGLDVARALNYLHQMQPDPIIHRDISSANVLLEPLPDSRWRAKVTDYGSVNLQQQLETVGPGNPTYAAPEANDPRLQSPKMDIFSFGILLIEMLTGQLPPSDERRQVMGLIHHHQLLALIERCLNQQRENRPNASDIISELEN